MIVEFNGLPGSGKTTITKKIVELLFQNGQKAFVWDDLTYGKNKSILFKIVKYLISINIIDLYYLLMITLSASEKLNIQQLKRILTAERICMAYKLINDSHDYYIIDQGIFQSIISIIHTYNISNSYRFIKYSNLLLNKFTCLHINTISTPEIALDRIRFRNFEKGSRFNYIADDSELLHLLSKLKTNILILRDNIKLDSIDIDISVDPLLNARFIVDKILNKNE